MPLRLDEAARLGMGIVTNDLFPDWVGPFPSVRMPGVLVVGQVADDVVRLDWAQDAAS